MTSFSITSRILLTLGFMAMLMLLSLIPGNAKPGDSAFIQLIADIPTLMQKTLHVGFYGVFALLLTWTLDDVQSRGHRFLIAFLIALAFGAAMEWLQTKIPGRIGNVFDIVLNAAGAALGLMVAAFIL